MGLIPEDKKPVIYFLAFILELVVISALDFMLKVEISLLYVGPVFFLSWYLFKNKTANIMCSILTALTITCVQYIEGIEQNLIYIFWNFSIRTMFLIGMSFMTMKLHNLLSQQKINSISDHLTCLLNRRGFEERLSSEILRYNRYHTPFSIAYLDLDNFKSVNDNYGHDVGDGLLKIMGTTIKNSIRSTDFSARLGGDEFSVVYLETKDKEIVKNLVEKLCTKINIELEKTDFDVTVSVGVVTIEWPYPAERPEDLVKLADSQMYSVKRTGKNSVSFSSI